MEFTIDIGDGNAETIEFTADKWHATGIAAGPGLNFSLLDKLNADLHVAGGIASVRMPAFYYNGEKVVKEDWGVGPLIQGGLGLRYYTNKQVFLFVNAEYQYMKPEFHLLDFWTDETDKVYQKIDLVNATAGIGIRF
jgi:hypothetical protein